MFMSWRVMDHLFWLISANLLDKLVPLLINILFFHSKLCSLPCEAKPIIIWFNLICCWLGNWLKMQMRRNNITLHWETWGSGDLSPINFISATDQKWVKWTKWPEDPLKIQYLGLSLSASICTRLASERGKTLTENCSGENRTFQNGIWKRVNR